MATRNARLISVAGFDPSGGAGVLADIKTFEAFNVTGFGVATAITYQTEDSFLGMTWLTTEQVISQLDPLLSQYDIDVVKIGLIELKEMLPAVLSLCNRYGVPVVWDPILSASAGFDFHATELIKYCRDYFNKFFLITPNIPEVRSLMGMQDEGVAALTLSKEAHVFLKGGHAVLDSDDKLFYYDQVFLYPSEKLDARKHGTGCVLSSAIAASFALSNDLREACDTAKDYINKYLLSSDELLGRHYTLKS